MKLLRSITGFSFNDVNRVLLGAISLVLTGVVILAVFAVGSLGLLKHRYQMSGVFPASAGVRNGDLVRVAGIDVGTVIDVAPDFSLGQVVITWEVDDGVELGPRTTAEISLATLLGGTYIKLGGTVEEPYMKSLPTAQRRIPIERTKSPATIDQLLNQTTHAIEQINVGNVNQLLGQLGTLTVDNQQTIGDLLTNLNTVSAAVNQRQEQVAQLVTNGQQITSTLASKDQALSQLLDNASSLLDEISARRDELATLLGSGAQVVTTLSNLVADHRAQIDAILDDLHATLTVTDKHLPDFDKFLTFVGPTFAGVGTITRSGPWLDAVAYGLGPADVNQLGALLGASP